MNIKQNNSETSPLITTSFDACKRELYFENFTFFITP
jgi:hypothetical protein